MQMTADVDVVIDVAVAAVVVVDKTLQVHPVDVCDFGVSPTTVRPSAALPQPSGLFERRGPGPRLGGSFVRHRRPRRKAWWFLEKSPRHHRFQWVSICSNTKPWSAIDDLGVPPF